MVVDWIANIGALSLGALAFYFFARRDTLHARRSVSAASLGALFGLLSALVVMMPVHFGDGTTFDTRAAPAILSGYFLGPLGGIITASIAGAARYWVGGPFVIGGSLSPFFYAAFGAIVGACCRHRDLGPGPLRLLSIAVVGTLFVLPCFFIDKGVEAGLQILENAWYLLLVGNVVGVVILGLMISEAKKFSVEHKALKSTLFLTDLARSSAGIAVWRFDMAANRLTWDDAMFRLFDVDPGSFKGEFNDWERTVHPDDIDAARRQFLEAYEKKSGFATDFRIVRRDGSVRWLAAHCNFLEDDAGNVTEAVGVNWDITDRKEMADSLFEREKEARLRSEELEVTLASVVQGVSAFDKDGRLRFCNDRAGEFTGLPPEMLMPGTSYHAYNQYRLGAFVTGFPGETTKAVPESAQPTSHIRSLIHLSNGRILSFSAAPMPDGGWVETYEDVTEKVVADERVKKAAETDNLTELANRLSFRETLDHVVENAGNADEVSPSLLLIDLNDFKAVNDSHGHVVGDRLLQHVANTLKAVIEGGDLAARLGGDEFALVLKPRTEEDIREIASGLCAAFDMPVNLDGLMVQSGLSVGVAIITADGAGSEETLSRADLALYKAKQEKRSAYRVFDADIAREDAERKRTKNALIRVVENQGLDVFCQPILNLETHRVDHFEALVRWHQGEASYVPPSNFIPLAEEIGLIAKVGDFVLSEVLRSLETWPDNYCACVNVSVLQLGDGRFVERVLGGLRAAGISPHRLELELTESVLMSAGSAAHEDLRKLRDAGLNLALDDFGIGFSSFGYLQELPFNKLKIDRRFVSEVEKDEGSAAILRTIAALADNLDMKSTAEGVETAQQLGVVRACGCHYGQGYFIGQPIPLEDVQQAYFEVPKVAKAALRAGRV